MGKIRSFLKKDNKGSTMVVALVAIAFVGVLASTILTATMANYKMKHINYKAKKTFYNAESAVDEIYDGLSKVCYDTLESEYMETVSHLIANSSNGDANASLMGRYKKAIKDLTVWSDKALLMEYLNGFITDTDNASVIDVNVDDINMTAMPFIIPDVTVQYREKATDDFSKVTIDLEMYYPNVQFDFIQDKNNLKTYLDFSMIGMEGVAVKTNVSESGGIYAGNGYDTIVSSGGLDVWTASSLQLDKNTSTPVASDTLIIANEVVGIKGSVYSNDAKIWTKNINVGDDRASTNGYFHMNGSSNAAYVSDDLTLSFGGSQAILAGEYWGYGGSNSLGAASSSAIIVNGKSSVLNTTDLNKLILAGSSYISIRNDSQDYDMGDSLGIKGMQRIYLVPNDYMNSSNPYQAKSGYGLDQAVNYEAMKNFFAYKAGYLETDGSGNPVIYTVSPSSGDTSSTYCYLKFKNELSRFKYVKSIIDLKYDGIDISSDPVATRLRNIVASSANNFLSNSSSSIGSAQSSGILYDKSSGMFYPSMGAAVDDAGCARKSYKYAILKRFLYDEDESKITDPFMPESQISITVADDMGTKVHSIKDFDENYKNYYDYVIETSEFRVTDTAEDGSIIMDASSELDPAKVKQILDDAIDDGYSHTGDENGCTIYKHENGESAVLALGETYRTSTGAQKGVILSYNGNVIVDSNFTGLIITNRKIEVAPGCSSIDADHKLAERIIKNNSILSKFFKAFRETNSGLNPEEITMEDLLTYSNWRKNYENEAESETGTEE